MDFSDYVIRAMSGKSTLKYMHINFNEITLQNISSVFVMYPDNKVDAGF